jgi:nucleotide-binding universal stress UspA family protein
MYERILDPLDQSELAETILPHAVAVARQFQAELILLNVAPSYEDVLRNSMPAGTAGASAAWVPSTDLIQETVDAGTNSGQRYVDGMASRLHDSGIRLRPVVAQGSAAETILLFCEDEDVSLIAISTHGHSGLVRTFLGSVADEVVRNVRRPVLLLRPQSA